MVQLTLFNDTNGNDHSKKLFKDINDYDGDYGISNNGDVISYKGKKTKLLKNYKNDYNTKNTYRFVYLCKDGKIYKHYIHRLVASHYLDKKNNYNVVMHLDNNKRNNVLSNLLWGTYKQNTQQAIKDGLVDNKKVIKVTRLKDGEVSIYNSLSCACKKLNLSIGNMSMVCSGIRTHTKGYKGIYL